jgi:hypothetical protein
MTRRRTWFGASVLLVSAALSACGDGTTQPAGSVTATATLSAPVTDGAVLLRVSGPGFGTVTAAETGTALYSRQVSDSEMVVAVFGTIASGPLFAVDLPAGRSPEEYAATVTQAADQSNDLRQDLSGYTISITVGTAAD